MTFNSLQLDQMIHQMTMGMMIYAPKHRTVNSTENNGSEDNSHHNEYTQMLLMPLFMTALGALITYLRMNGTNIFYTILQFFSWGQSKSCARIDFEGSISKMPNRTKIDFDMGMGSVFYYIFNNFSQVKGLKYLRRIPDKNRDEYYESIVYRDEGEKSQQERSLQTQFFEEFFLAQTTPIRLPNGIQVVPETHRDETTSDDNNSKKKKMGITTNYLLSICYDKYDNPEKNMSKLLEIYGEMKQTYLEFKRKDREDPVQYIYTFDSKEDDNVYFHRYPIQETKKFCHLFFQGKESFIRELSNFQHGRETYRKRGKAYRKIILAYGEPGCGKTSLLMCLLNHMKCAKNTFTKQLIHLKLDKLSRKNLMDILFQETLHVSDIAASKIKVPFDRRIYVIEEIDGYEMTHTRSLHSKTPNQEKYQKMLKANREKISKTEDEEEIQHLRDISSFLKESILSNPKEKDNQLQIQDLLEALDGIPSMQNGEIIFMTTNHIEKIDPALKREGRVNHLMEFKRSRDTETLQFMESYYRKNLEIKTKQRLRDIFRTNGSRGWTPAHIESICETSKNPEEAISKLLNT